MKKHFFSLFSLVAMLLIGTGSAWAESLQLLYKNSDGLIICKSSSELNGCDYDQKAGDDGKESYFYMPAGTVFYEDDNLCISATVTSSIWPKGWTSAGTHYADHFINLGSTLGSISEDTNISNVSGLTSGNQSTLLLKAKVSGEYTAKIYPTNNTMIGIYMLYTDAEQKVNSGKTGKFIAIQTLTKNTAIDWTVSLEAGKEYYLVATSTNTNLRAQKFSTVTLHNVTVESMPAAGGTIECTPEGKVANGGSLTLTASTNPGYAFLNWTDQEGNVVSEESTYTIASVTEDVNLIANFEMTSLFSLLCKRSDGLIICKSSSELNGCDYDQKAGDDGKESYFYMPAGTVFYEDDNLCISATVTSSIWPKGWTSAGTHYADHFINLGSTLGSISEDTNISNVSGLTSGNQSTLLLKAKVSGEYTAKIYPTNNTMIGIYMLYTDAEQKVNSGKTGKFIAIQTLTKQIAIDWTISLEAGREYYLVATSTNTNLRAQKFVPSYDVTVGTSGFSTFYADCSVSLPNGVTAYVAELNADKTCLTLTEIESGYIPSKTGVVISAAPGQYTFESYWGEVAAMKSVLTGVSTRTLRSSVSGENALYVLSTQNGETAFYQYTGEYIPANKAVLLLSQSLNAPKVRIASGVTSIENIKQEVLGEAPVIFNMQGQKMQEALVPGLYIINGKKVLVK